FAPGPDALPAAPLHVVLTLDRSLLQSRPEMTHPVILGRDARIFPSIRLSLFTYGDALVPAERGRMLVERGAARPTSYWSVIPEPGKVWREAADGGWSRGALVLMLVNDTENHAHQGIATFMYRGTRVSRVRFQFVQQTAPYLLHQHFIAWGSTAARVAPDGSGSPDTQRQAFAAELAQRLPTRPWQELERDLPPGTLAGFGGPLLPKWQVTAALVRDGVLYYQPVPTPYGPFPYPLQMRFGVRSIMKSVAAPLAMLRLAQLYGPQLLDLYVGDLVKGLPEKFQRVRLIDLANMASGFGGTGTFNTHPNDGFDGYLGGDYDGWYTAPSLAEKLARIADWKPYPWAPGTIFRYRDQDYFLLGAALDAYLKSVRGPSADLWDFVTTEVLRPIGIMQAPAVRTREPDGRPGLVWCNAGYYPTLDDLAKIALLYQHRGEHAGVQLLHRGLTGDLLAARGALDKAGDGSPAPATGWTARTQLYRMGLHFMPYVGSRSKALLFLPTMFGSGDNQVILYPNGLVSIRIAKAAEIPPGEAKDQGDEDATARAVDRLDPF
ncbi:MAG: beta-lactamase family protein, partial [Proteobacteria bacterium]|nr:beta-lactamase family protein [Pseudomonadota bacterium]